MTWSIKTLRQGLRLSSVECPQGKQNTPPAEANEVFWVIYDDQQILFATNDTGVKCETYCVG